MSSIKFEWMDHESIENEGLNWLIVSNSFLFWVDGHIMNGISLAILNVVCKNFLNRNVSTILFLSNTELYGRNTAAAQYFLQLTNYLRLPVIAWNADNSGLEKVSDISFFKPILLTVSITYAIMLNSAVCHYSYKLFKNSAQFYGKFETNSIEAV